MSKARYAIVEPELWSRAKLRDLSDPARVVLMYLLTCEASVPIPGVILGGVGTHCDRLRRPARWFRKALDELCDAGVHLHVDLEAGLIWLPSAIGKYQSPTSASQARGWSNAWRLIPDSVLREELRTALRNACAPLAGAKLNGRDGAASALPGPEHLFVDQRGTGEATAGSRDGSTGGRRVPVPQGSGIRDQGTGNRDQGTEAGTESTAPGLSSPVEKVVTTIGELISEHQRGSRAQWTPELRAELQDAVDHYGPAEVQRRAEGYFVGYGRPEHFKPPYDAKGFVRAIDMLADAAEAVEVGAEL